MTILSETMTKKTNVAPPGLMGTAATSRVAVREGDDAFLLVFKTPGSGPILQLTWAKGSRPLVGDRYRVGENNNTVHLTLEGATRDDGGEYTVTAKNIAGESRSSVHLRIKDESFDDDDDTPVFLRRLNDLAVKVGTRTRFLVEIPNSSDVKVTWHRNDLAITDDERYHLLHEGNFFCVDVAPVAVEDSGRWTCMAENQAGRASCSCRLNVLVPKAYKAPEFLEELKAILTEQGTVSLECKVVGVPTPLLRWFKDGKEIKAGDVFALSANAADPTSLGTYTCEATNCMGKTYSSSRVHVVGRSREGSLQLTDNLPPCGPPPRFQQNLQEKKVKVGTAVTLSCAVAVPPWPRTIAWYNKEGHVECSEKYHIMEDGLGGYSIEIFPVEEVDEGEWKCVATSDAGVKGITQCNVLVTYPKNYRKPRFLESLKAILTEEGLVSFECKVVGFPTPQLQWFKDGQELRPGDVYQLTGTNSLGSYSCVARNCMGVASSSAELTVEDIHNQLNDQEKSLLFSLNQPPKFIVGLKSSEAKINEAFRFTVQVTISPEPKVAWYRDDEQVNADDRYVMSRESLGVCHLDVKCVEILDQAEWKCVATNKYGHTVSSGFLKLTIPKHFKTPRFLECLQAILTETGAVNLECKVIGVPQPVLKWYKDGRELKAGDIHRIISGEDGTCCLGTYTCEAHNCMGSVSSSASLLGFEERVSRKQPIPIKMELPYPLAKNASLSTIHEERTSQLFDTPATEHSVTMDERGDVSFSFDGKEVSISLYETPDLTEDEALQIVEMYAEELSENVSEHNIVELPPLRFIKETSKSGPLVMEAVVIDVTPEYFTSADDDLRTEADFEDVSMMDELSQQLGSPAPTDDDVFGKIDAEFLERALAPLTGAEKSQSIDEPDSFHSISSPKRLSKKDRKHSKGDATLSLDLGTETFVSAKDSGSPEKKLKKQSRSRSTSIDPAKNSFDEKFEEGIVTVTPKRKSVSRSSSAASVERKNVKHSKSSEKIDDGEPKTKLVRSKSSSIEPSVGDAKKKVSRSKSGSIDANEGMESMGKRTKSGSIDSVGDGITKKKLRKSKSGSIEPSGAEDKKNIVRSTSGSIDSVGDGITKKKLRKSKSGSIEPSGAEDKKNIVRSTSGSIDSSNEMDIKNKPILSRSSSAIGDASPEEVKPTITKSGSTESNDGTLPKRKLRRSKSGSVGDNEEAKKKIVRSKSAMLDTAQQNIESETVSRSNSATLVEESKVKKRRSVSRSASGSNDGDVKKTRITRSKSIEEAALEEGAARKKVTSVSTEESQIQRKRLSSVTNSLDNMSQLSRKSSTDSIENERPMKKLIRSTSASLDKGSKEKLGSVSRSSSATTLHKKSAKEASDVLSETDVSGQSAKGNTKKLRSRSTSMDKSDKSKLRESCESLKDIKLSERLRAFSQDLSESFNLGPNRPEISIVAPEDTSFSEANSDKELRTIGSPVIYTTVTNSLKEIQKNLANIEERISHETVDYIESDRAKSNLATLDALTHPIQEIQKGLVMIEKQVEFEQVSERPISPEVSLLDSLARPIQDFEIGLKLASPSDVETSQALEVVRLAVNHLQDQLVEAKEKALTQPGTDELVGVLSILSVPVEELLLALWDRKAAQENLEMDQNVAEQSQTSVELLRALAQPVQDLQYAIEMAERRARQDGFGATLYERPCASLLDSLSEPMKSLKAAIKIIEEQSKAETDEDSVSEKILETVSGPIEEISRGLSAIEEQAHLEESQEFDSALTSQEIIETLASPIHSLHKGLAQIVQDVLFPSKKRQSIDVAFLSSLKHMQRTCSAISTMVKSVGPEISQDYIEKRSIFGDLEQPLKDLEEAISKIAKAGNTQDIIADGISKPLKALSNYLFELEQTLEVQDSGFLLRPENVGPIIGSLKTNVISLLFEIELESNEKSLQEIFNPLLQSLQGLQVLLGGRKIPPLQKSGSSLGKSLDLIKQASEEERPATLEKNTDEPKVSLAMLRPLEKPLQDLEEGFGVVAEKIGDYTAGAAAEGQLHALLEILSQSFESFQEKWVTIEANNIGDNQTVEEANALLSLVGELKVGATYIEENLNELKDLNEEITELIDSAVGDSVTNLKKSLVQVESSLRTEALDIVPELKGFKASFKKLQETAISAIQCNPKSSCNYESILTPLVIFIENVKKSGDGCRIETGLSEIIRVALLGLEKNLLENSTEHESMPPDLALLRQTLITKTTEAVGLQSSSDSINVLSDIVNKINECIQMHSREEPLDLEITSEHVTVENVLSEIVHQLDNSIVVIEEAQATVSLIEPLTDPLRQLSSKLSALKSSTGEVVDQSSVVVLQNLLLPLRTLEEGLEKSSAEEKIECLGAIKESVTEMQKAVATVQQQTALRLDDDGLPEISQPLLLETLMEPIEYLMTSLRKIERFLIHEEEHHHPEVTILNTVNEIQQHFEAHDQGTPLQCDEIRDRNIVPGNNETVEVLDQVSHPSVLDTQHELQSAVIVEIEQNDQFLKPLPIDIELENIERSATKQLENNLAADRHSQEQSFGTQVVRATPALIEEDQEQSLIESFLKSTVDDVSTLEDISIADEKSSKCSISAELEGIDQYIGTENITLIRKPKIIQEAVRNDELDENIKIGIELEDSSERLSTLSYLNTQLDEATQALETLESYGDRNVKPIVAQVSGLIECLAKIDSLTLESADGLEQVYERLVRPVFDLRKNISLLQQTTQPDESIENLSVVPLIKAVAENVRDLQSAVKEISYTVLESVAELSDAVPSLAEGENVTSEKIALLSSQQLIEEPLPIEMPVSEDVSLLKTVAEPMQELEKILVQIREHLTLEAGTESLSDKLEISMLETLAQPVKELHSAVEVMEHAASQMVSDRNNSEGAALTALATPIHELHRGLAQIQQQMVLMDPVDLEQSQALTILEALARPIEVLYREFVAVHEDVLCEPDAITLSEKTEVSLLKTFATPVDEVRKLLAVIEQYEILEPDPESLAAMDNLPTLSSLAVPIQNLQQSVENIEQFILENTNLTEDQYLPILEAVAKPVNKIDRFIAVAQNELYLKDDSELLVRAENLDLLKKLAAPLHELAQSLTVLENQIIEPAAKSLGDDSYGAELTLVSPRVTTPYGGPIIEEQIILDGDFSEISTDSWQQSHAIEKSATLPLVAIKSEHEVYVKSEGAEILILPDMDVNVATECRQEVLSIMAIEEHLTLDGEPISLASELDEHTQAQEGSGALPLFAASIKQDSSEVEEIVTMSLQNETERAIVNERRESVKSTALVEQQEVMESGIATESYVSSLSDRGDWDDEDERRKLESLPDAEMDLSWCTDDYLMPQNANLDMQEALRTAVIQDTSTMSGVATLSKSSASLTQVEETVQTALGIAENQKHDELSAFETLSETDSLSKIEEIADINEESMHLIDNEIDLIVTHVDLQECNGNLEAHKKENEKKEVKAEYEAEGKQREEEDETKVDKKKKIEVAMVKDEAVMKGKEEKEIKVEEEAYASENTAEKKKEVNEVKVQIDTEKENKENDSKAELKADKKNKEKEETEDSMKIKEKKGAMANLEGEKTKNAEAEKQKEAEEANANLQVEDEKTAEEDAKTKLEAEKKKKLEEKVEDEKKKMEAEEANAKLEAEKKKKAEEETKAKLEAENTKKAEEEAETERKKKEAEEAKAKLDSEKKKKAEDEAEAKKKTDEEAKAKLEAEMKKAEEEAKAKEEAEKLKKAEEEAKAKLEAEKKKKEAEEARAKLEAEKNKKAEEEAKAKLQAEKTKKAEEEAEAERKKKEAEEDRLDSEKKKKAEDEAEAEKKKKNDQEAKAKLEAEMKKVEEEAKAKEEAEKIKKAEEEAKAKLEAEKKMKAEEEADKKKKEAEEARAKLEAEKKKKGEEEAKAKLEAEKTKKAEEEAEAERKKKEAEEAKSKLEAEKKKKAEDEADKEKKETEEAKAKLEAEKKKKAEDEAKVKLEAEKTKKAEEEAEAERKKKEADEAKSKLEAEKKKKAEEEAESERKRKVEEESKANLEAEKKKKAQEEAEAEKKKKKAEEAKSKLEAEKKKEEAETKAKLEAEKMKKANEKAEKKKAEEEAKAKEEAEKIKKAEEDAKAEKKKKAEEEADKKEKEAEEAKAKLEAEKKKKAEEEAKAKLEAEKKKNAEEEDKADKEAEEAKTKLDAEKKKKAEEEAKAKLEAEKTKIAVEDAEAERKEQEAEEAKSKLEAEMKKKAEKEAESEKKRKAEEEAKAKIEAEKKKKAQEEAEAEAKKKAEEEAKAKLEAEKMKAEEEAKAKLEAEKKKKAQEEAEAEAKKKAEEEAMAKLEAEKMKAEEEAKAKLEAEKKKKAEEEAEADKKKKEAEEAKTKLDAGEKKKADEKAKAKLEAEKTKKAKEEAEAERKKKEAEEAKLKLEVEKEKKAAEEAESERKMKAEEEAKAKVEAEKKKKAQEEADAEAKKIAGEEAKAKLEAEKKKKAEEEAKAKLEAEKTKKAKEEAEAERKKKEAEEAKLKLEAEKEKKAEEEAESEKKMKAEEEAKAKVEAEKKKKAQEGAEAEAKKIAEEEAKAKLEAEKKKNAEEEAEADKKKKEAEEAKTKLNAEKKKKADEEAKAKLEAENTKKAEEEAEAERKKKEAEEAKSKLEAEKKKKAEKEAESEKKRKAEEEAKAMLEAETKKKAAEEAKAKLEVEKKKKAEEEGEAKKMEAEEAKSKLEAEKKKEEDEAKAILEAKMKNKAEEEAKAKLEAEKKKKADEKAEAENKEMEAEEAKSKLGAENKKEEEEAKAMPEAKKKKKAEEEAKAKLEAEKKKKAEEKAEGEKKENEAEEAKAKLDFEKKKKAEEGAESEKKIKAEEEAKAKLDAKEKKKVEAEMKKKAEEEAEDKKKKEAATAEHEAEKKEEEAKPKLEAKEKKKAEAEKEKKAEEEAEADKKKRKEEEAKAKLDAEKMKKAEEEADAERKKNAEEKAKTMLEAEEKKKEAEEAKAKLEAEEKKKAEEAKTKLDVDEKNMKAEEEAKAEKKKKAGEEAIAKQEAEKKKKAAEEAEAQRKKMAEEEAKAKLEAEEKKKEAEQAKTKLEVDETNKKAEEEAKAEKVEKAEEEDKAKLEAEKKMKAEGIAEAGKIKKDAEDEAKANNKKKEEQTENKKKEEDKSKKQVKEKLGSEKKKKKGQSESKPELEVEKDMTEKGECTPNLEIKKVMKENKADANSETKIISKNEIEAQLVAEKEQIGENSTGGSHSKREDKEEKMQSKIFSEYRAEPSKLDYSQLPGTKDRPKKPAYTSRLVDCTIPKNSKIHLTCSVIGNPEPSVKWYREGVVVKLSDSKRIFTSFNDGVATLNISDAEVSDSGEYSCVARNRNGEITTSCTVKVFSSYEPEPSLPEFTKPIGDSYKLSDDTLVLECRVQAQPAPKVTWMKNGLPIEARSRYQQYESVDGMCQLTIFGPDRSDSGEYTCRAQNALNVEETSATVQFRGREFYSEQKDRRSVPRVTKDFRRPYFASELTDHLVSSGGTVALQVEVKGVPHPEVQWLRGPEVLPRASSHIRTFEDSGLYTLLVSNASEKEAGLYTCRASNNFGFVDSTAAVEVIPAGAVRGGKAAHLITRPEDSLTVAEEDDLILTCRVGGDPRPRVNWLKGVRDITVSQRSMIDHSDDYYRFTLKRCTPSDAGTYWIIAKNAYGTDRAFITVNVRHRARSLTPGSFASKWGSSSAMTSELLSDIHDRERYTRKETPGPISGEPIVADCGKNWMTLSWQKPSVRGAGPVVAYRVDAWELGQDGGARWVELGISPVNTFDAFNLKEGHEYKFRITPRNRYGWGEPMVTSRPILVGFKPTYLPEFSKILPGQLKALLGATIRLECQVDCDTTPIVTWHRDGTLLDPSNARFSTRFDGRTCQLIIEDLQEEDSGRYMCEAVNQAGRVSTFARLLVVSDPKIWAADNNLRRGVIEEEGTILESPPQFTMRLRDRRVQQTYPVRLTCQAVGHPYPEITWSKDGVAIKQDERRIFWNDDHFFTLEITKALLEDSGVYSVQARNQHGAVACRCHLVVDKGIRAYVAPEFIGELDLVRTLKVGGELRLQAQVEAYPSVGVVWHRDSTRLRPSRRIVMTLDYDGTTELAIASVTDRDAGVYTCTAINAVGRCQTTCRVAIKQDGAGPDIPIIQDPQLPYSKTPLFLKKPRSTDAVEGDSVIIECEVVGDPKPEVFWLRDFLKPDYYRDAPLFRRVGDGPAYRLEIPHVKLDHTGTYSLVARNAHGEAKAIISLQVYVKGLGKDDGMPRRPVTRGNVETLPAFKKGLKDLRCCDGDAVTLECEVEHGAGADVRWERAGKLVRLGGDVLAEFDGRIARLSINHVYPEDEGEYTCIAFNDLGHTPTSACLLVDVPEEKENALSQQLHRPTGLLSGGSTPRSTPRTTPSRSMSPYTRSFSPRHLEPISTPKRLKVAAPKFYAIPHNRVAEEGETVRFQCAIAGHPTPWATWDKNGIVVTPSARISLVERDDLRLLEISEVTIEDAGLYRITLENDVGRIEATARLEVIGPHGYKTKVANRAHSSSPRVSPSFRRRLVGGIGRLGDRINLACDIRGAPSPVPSWYRNGELIVMTDRFIPAWDGTTAMLEISELAEEDEGVYTCMAQNELGRAQCSTHLEVTSADDNLVTEPPTFEKGLSDETLIEGASAELIVQIQGASPMDVVWVKDGVEVPDCPDFRHVDYGNGRFGLRFADVFGEDAAHYTCEAFNQYGEAVTAAVISVKDPLSSSPPTFAKKPTSVVVTSGRSASFCARLQAAPKTVGPRSSTTLIRWAIGDTLVPSEPPSKYLVEDDDDVSILHVNGVERRDAGQVTVVARTCCPACRTADSLTAVLACSCGPAATAVADLTVLPDNWASDSEADAPPPPRMRSRSLSTSEIEVDLPKISRAMTGFSDESPALLLRGPADLNVLQGEKVILSASYCGQPEPIVRWLRGGHEIKDGERVRIETGEGVSSLTITSITSDDSGKYVVSVENVLGADCHFASVSVEGPPDPPAGRPSVSACSPTSVSVAWSSPHFDGGHKLSGYRVEAQPDGSDTWQSVSDTTDSLATVISNLDAAVTYRFRVRAVNIHGNSEPGAESDPISLASQRHPEDLTPVAVSIQSGDDFKARYSVLEELGKGRYGVVHKVVDSSTEQRLAAKFIRVIKVADREKVKEEIDIMSSLRHPKLLQLAAAFESPREMVMVMEYITGGELFERVVADDFQLTERDCILFMRQICEGVAYMHSRQVVHLDLKPENIMCQTRTSHEIKLIDFGLAQRLNPDTPVRVLFGTPEFVPPEIINYEPIGLESDMWSVGVVCYVLLSGLSPFMGETDAETFANITRADFDFEDDAFDAISTDAKDFISSLLVKRKEKRLLATECLKNKWMLSEHEQTKAVVISTDKLKKFIIRRKWQKTGNAIRALGRMANLSAASRRNSSSSSTASSPRPSIATSRFAEKLLEEPDEKNRGRFASERSDSGFSDCSTTTLSSTPLLSHGNSIAESEEIEVTPKSNGRRLSSEMDEKVEGIRKKFANLSQNIYEMDKKLESVGKKLEDIGPIKISPKKEIQRTPSLKETKVPSLTVPKSPELRTSRRNREQTPPTSRGQTPTRGKAVSTPPHSRSSTPTRGKSVSTPPHSRGSTPTRLGMTPPHSRGHTPPRVKSATLPKNSAPLYSKAQPPGKAVNGSTVISVRGAAPGGVSSKREEFLRLQRMYDQGAGGQSPSADEKATKGEVPRSRTSPTFHKTVAFWKR